MGNKFSSGKFAFGFCDRCGQRYKLGRLKPLFIKVTQTNILCCPTCWDPSHPQLMQGMYPVEDPQALRNPRPDLSYLISGNSTRGTPGEGSRVIEWGWNPAGGASQFLTTLTPNSLQTAAVTGVVTVATS